MNRPLFCLLAPLVLTACASSGFSTTSSSSGPRQPQEQVVVVESDAGEVRAAELRKQQQQIDDLRDALDASRARADAAARRSDAASQKALSTIDAMESQIAELKLRSDAAVAQADKSFALAKEFLSNIVDAREEQSVMVQQNTTKFDRVERRLADIEGNVLDVRKLSQSELATAQSQSSTIEQSLRNTDLQLLALSEQAQLANKQYAESRKRSQAELAAVRARASEMEQQLALADQKLKRAEQKLKETEQRFAGLNAQLQQSNRNSEKARKLSQAQLMATIARSAEMEQKLNVTDKQLAAMREQLLQANRNIEDTRAAMDSGPMLDMLRRMESTQRETSALRGLVEEMQQEQVAARKRLQDYYLDLDARIQDLQARERAAREEAEARRLEAENAPIPELQDIEIPAATDVTTGNMDEADVSGAADPEPSVVNTPLQSNQIEVMPLPEETPPVPTLDPGISEPNDEMLSSPGDVSADDAIADTEPEDLL